MTVLITTSLTNFLGISTFVVIKYFQLTAVLIIYGDIPDVMTRFVAVKILVTSRMYRSEECASPGTAFVSLEGAVKYGSVQLMSHLKPQSTFWE